LVFGYCSAAGIFLVGINRNIVCTAFNKERRPLAGSPFRYQAVA
jgi:hypothetical protein